MAKLSEDTKAIVASNLTLASNVLDLGKDLSKANDLSKEVISSRNTNDMIMECYKEFVNLLED